MTTPDHQWHWGEGNKYALEGMKTLLLLNGGAAVVLLTFVGNKALENGLSQSAATAVGWSLIAFGFGTICSVLVFTAAYVTQLHYGNRALNGDGKDALRAHLITYLFVGGSILGFLLGIFLAHNAVIASLKIVSKAS